MLLIETTKYDRALEYLELALQISERQNARILSLRAAISLYMFNKKTKLYPDAKKTLLDIFNKFEKNAGSLDQLTAQNLLAQ